MAVASVLFAVMGLFVKIASHSVAVSQVVFFRNGLGLLLLLAGAALWRIPLQGQNRRMLLIRSISGCVALALYFFAISRIPLADAVLLNYTSPFFATLLAWIVLKEPVAKGMLMALLVAFVGVILVVHPTGAWDPIGSLAGLASGAFAGAAYVAVRRMRGVERPWVIVTWFAAVASALTLPWALMAPSWPTPEVWPAVGMVALCATVAQLFMTRAYRGLSNVVGGTASLLTVVVASVLGAVFLNEPPDLWTVMGGGLILGSSLWLAKGSPASA